MHTPENPSSFDSDNNRFNIEKDVTYADKEWLEDAKIGPRNFVPESTMCILSAYMLDLSEDSFFKKLSAKKIEEMQNTIRLTDNGTLRFVKDKLGMSVNLLLHGIEPSLKHKDFGEMIVTIRKEMRDIVMLSRNDIDKDNRSKAMEEFRIEEVLEMLFNLQLLNELPQSLIDQDFSSTLKHSLKERLARMPDTNLKLSFSTIIRQAAQMKVVGCGPVVSPELWDEARQWLDDQREDFDETKDTDKTEYKQERFLDATGALTILASDEVEVAPEGGLILDGNRIGEPLY